MLEVLAGSGLALSAGLNAYIPMLSVALLARFTDLVTLPTQWLWLENTWVIVILGVLLTVEVVADKVPAVDHVNDIIQTVVRPTAGGIVFAAGSSAQTPAITDPAEFFASEAFWPFLLGVVLALCTHVAKAGARAVVNATTAGVGAPVASTVEDGASVAMTILAILLPALIAVCLALLAASLWWLARRRAQSRSRRAAP